jgi:hypothetical protein
VLDSDWGHRPAVASTGPDRVLDQERATSGWREDAMTRLNANVSGGARLGRGDLTIMSAQYGKQPRLTDVCTVCSQRLKLRKGGTLWMHARRKPTGPATQIPRAGGVKRSWPAAARKSVRRRFGGPAGDGI